METMVMIDNKLEMSPGGLVYEKNNISTRLADLMEEIARLLEVEKTYNIARIIQYIDEYDPCFFEKYAESLLSKVI